MKTLEKPYIKTYGSKADNNEIYYVIMPYNGNQLAVYATIDRQQADNFLQSEILKGD